ncbi:hypothetical protein [Microvirga roseola]|uniref:hypothetical protein n=1 Tax=Microvirga roseola TaxID=2883126 RepID=UPI001E59BDAD|nr:hypothetical protein [Microvirga roseola]
MRAFLSRHGWRPLPLALALGALAACGESEAPDDIVNPPQVHGVARVLPASEVLSGAHIPTLDPAPMVDAEIQKVVGAGPRCDFHYTRAGRPVLAVGMQPDGTATGGVVKLNGSLVALASELALAGGGAPPARFLLLADPVRVAVAPVEGEEAQERDGAQSQRADMVFEISRISEPAIAATSTASPRPG